MLLKKCLYLSILLLPILLLPAFALGQRLPAGVTPQHYDLTFTPDLQKATFSGEETIEVDLAKPAASITLNAAELEFQKVEITQSGKTQEAQSSFAPEKEQATLTVPESLQAGPATMHLVFTGVLNSQLRGFYLAKSRVRNYATTQFEATDARRAFPSFDEPALKAKFDITLIVDRGDTAISNGSIVSDTPGPGENKHTLKFSTTPKMSTYLVAMAVGDFECDEGSADNIPVRVCGTPDKKPLGAAALRYAEEILKFYNQYYGISYPFGKLDIVGVPDFEAGAMENTAAIFYRESELFIDDKDSSAKSHQNVFEVLAHEMAHQWFGDLVTMKWWDNVWLNEGFATWMALKPSQALHPEWNAALDAVRETDNALRADALQHTHPIRATAETPEQINEMFDAISYEKGAAVLRMIESYVTPDVFRRGVNAYLRKFAYSNATAEDFWRSLAAASGRPVDAIMPTFVEQPGEPLIGAQSACAAAKPEPAARRSRRSRRRRALPKAQPKTEITLTQARFWADPSAAHGAAATWMVPVCVKSDDAKPFCQVVSQKEQVVPVAGCGTWTFVNANASGYYRTQYDRQSLEKLTGIAATALTTAERMSLLNDQQALAYSGEENVSSYLNLIAALNQDGERAVVESYLPGLESVNDYLLTDSDQKFFREWVRANFSPMLGRVGWSPASGESEDTSTLRGHLIKILGQIGQDPEVIQHSVQLAQQYLKDRHSVDPSMMREVLQVAASSNDPELFRQYMQAISAPGATPEEIANFASALANFTDFELTQQWLQKIVAPETRNQDAPFYVGGVLDNMAVQKPAWEWVKQHWPEVKSKLPAGIFSGGFARATANFCDPQMRSDVQQFFTEQKLAGTGRALNQSLERMSACIDFRSRQQTNLAAWLQQHPASEQSGNSSGR